MRIISVPLWRATCSQLGSRARFGSKTPMGIELEPHPPRKGNNTPSFTSSPLPLDNSCLEKAHTHKNSVRRRTRKAPQGRRKKRHIYHATEIVGARDRAIMSTCTTLDYIVRPACDTRAQEANLLAKRPNFALPE